MALLVIAIAVVLAFANGANDVSKAIATLVGSGTSRYRAAAAWAAVTSAGGAVVAALGGQALAASFSGAGLVTAPTSSAAAVALSVALAAVVWVLLATRFGLPVSTTHAITGALCGVGLAAGGMAGVQWSALGKRFLLPLAVSPLLAIAIMSIVAVVARSSTSGARAAAARGPEAGFISIDVWHWLSAGSVSFCRGLNDTPKIVALALLGGKMLHLQPIDLYIAVAAAMFAGSVVWGYRVTETLASKISVITPAGGFSANVVTAILVGLASKLALPVSTTHVASGAIIGLGIADRRQPVDRRRVKEMIAAWIITLPASAAVAAAIYFMIA